MVGRSSRRKPRPQQQNMYNGAGSQAGHGGEYVQLTWLVSGSQFAMWCEAMGRSRAISKKDGAKALLCLYNQQVVAHSAHFHQSDSESPESESDGVCTRVVRGLGIAS